MSETQTPQDQIHDELFEASADAFGAAWNAAQEAIKAMDHLQEMNYLCAEAGFGFDELEDVVREGGRRGDVPEDVIEETVTQHRRLVKMREQITQLRANAETKPTILAPMGEAA